jgi:hypothetical protein
MNKALNFTYYINSAAYCNQILLALLYLKKHTNHIG